MSTQQQRPRLVGTLFSEEWVHDNIDQIRFEANSDAPDAWVFQRILDEVEERQR